MKYRWLILYIVLMSCTDKEIIDLEKTNDIRLVVFGEFTNEKKVQEIHLSTTSDYFIQAPVPVISGAIITVDDGEEITELIEKEPGIYQTPGIFQTLPGVAYTLTIKDVDINKDGIFETYEARSITPQTVFIDGMAIRYNDKWKRWDVGVFFREPGETENYYLFKLYKNDVLYTNTMTKYQILSDKNINGKEISGIIVHDFDKEKGKIVNNNDFIKLDTYSITKEYYNFINGLKLETEDRIPFFSGPSANLKGNISGGALGFFATTSVTHNAVYYNGE